MILMMRTTNIRFSMLMKSATRYGVVTVSLIALLTNYWGTASHGQVTKLPSNQSASLPFIRIMPADGAAFLVEQRFDIRVEAPAGVSSPLHVLLDGRDISDWNNRNHLTGGSITPPSATITKAPAFLSRDWAFPRAGKHMLRATAQGAAAGEVSFEIIAWQGSGAKVRNVILMIGGRSFTHRSRT